MIYKTMYQSPFGEILLASNGSELVGLWFEKQKYYASCYGSNLIEKNDLEIFIETKKWLDEYFNKEEPSIDRLALNPEGSEFAKEVWQILCEIPYGKVITYGDIAKEIAKKRNKKTMSAQAVGGAVGHNPISIIIPCHRVVGTNNSLTGYGGGLDRKIALLELEDIDMKQYYRPTKGTAL